MTAPHIANTTTGIRIELHASLKSAKQSELRWLAMGFKTRLYWVSETSEDTLCGLEVAA
jgi:hypothetical protein